MAEEEAGQTGILITSIVLLMDPSNKTTDVVEVVHAVDPVSTASTRTTLRIIKGNIIKIGAINGSILRKLMVVGSRQIL